MKLIVIVTGIIGDRFTGNGDLRSARTPTTSSSLARTSAPTRANPPFYLRTDPRESSFFRAMQLADGVLLVLDPEATPFTRIWCAFEEATVVERSFVPASLLPDMGARFLRFAQNEAEAPNWGAAEQLEHFGLLITAHYYPFYVLLHLGTVFFEDATAGSRGAIRLPAPSGLRQAASGGPAYRLPRAYSLPTDPPGAVLAKLLGMLATQLAAGHTLCTDADEYLARQVRTCLDPSAERVKSFKTQMSQQTDMLYSGMAMLYDIEQQSVLSTGLKVAEATGDFAASGGDTAAQPLFMY